MGVKIANDGGAGPNDTGFTHNTDDFESTARAFDKAAPPFSSAVTTFTGSIHSLGQPWGTSSSVQKWAAQFTQNQTAILTALSTLVQGVDSVAPTLRQHAGNSNDTDAAVASALGS